MAARRPMALLAILPLALAPALTAQTFEGVVRQRVVEVGLDALADRGFDTSDALFDVPIEDILSRMGVAATVSEDEILIRGPRIRMDVSDEEMSGWVTVDVESGIVRMVNPEDGMFIEMTESDLARMASMGGDFDGAAPEVTDTGRSSTIQGMQARAFDVVTEDGIGRIWVTRDDAELADAFLALAERATAMSMGDAPDPSMVVAEHGMPVRTQEIDYDQYRVEEVVAVERRSVSADLFDPPAGLRKMTMQDMFGGAMPGAGSDRASGRTDRAVGGLGARGTSRGDAAASALGGLAGLLGGGGSAAAWIEYEVSGAFEASGREEDVVMCGETDSGLQARSLGDVVIGFEAEGSGDGQHAARFDVAGPDGRYEGRGRIVIEGVGTDPLGLPIYEVEFEGTGLEARAGGTVSVTGSLSCSAM